MRGFDPDLVELLIERSAQAGIVVRPATTVTAVDRTDSGYQVDLEVGGTPVRIECDLIVHGAVFEGKVAASNLVNGMARVPDYAGVPTAVFTIPELARVGMLEPEAREQGLDIDVRYRDTSGWYSSYQVGETTAAAKVLVDRDTDQVVGADLLGPEYAELINVLGLAMKVGLTTRQLKSITAAYPTVGSDLGSML